MLGKIKLILGIKDNSKDDILNYFIQANANKIINVIDEKAISQRLEFIVIELTVKQYNRLGSEGVASESIDGISYTYDSTTDELIPYKAFLKKYTSSNKFRFV